MLYLVQTQAAIAQANKIDAGAGPGPTFTKLVERFKPDAIYGSPVARSIILIVELDTPVKIAELMYVLTWFTGTEPTFTPIIKPEVYGEAITAAKDILPPPT